MSNEQEVIDFDQAKGPSLFQDLGKALDPNRALRVMGEIHAPVQIGATERLLQLAIQGNANMETIERFLAAKNAEEARESRKIFFEHFALMQAELKPVEKTKEAKKDGRTMYSYAPIEDLVRENGPIIARHGFAYTWRESDVEGGRLFTVIITGWGHSEETSVKIPTVAGTSMMNAAQAAMSMSTYGRRYSLMLGFGITTKEEDDDAQGLTFDVGVRLAEEIKLIRDALDQEQLKNAYMTAIRGKSDEDKKAIIQVKNIRYKELTGGAK